MVGVEAIAAVASAVAACASCYSVVLSRRSIEDASTARITIHGTLPGRTGTFGLLLHNTGRVAALDTITVSANERWSYGRAVRGGLVHAGETQEMSTPLQPPPDGAPVVAVAVYRTNGRLHIVNALGDRKILSPRRSKQTWELPKLWRMVYPKVELPPAWQPDDGPS